MVDTNKSFRVPILPPNVGLVAADHVHVCVHRPTFDEVVFSLQGILLEQRQGSSEGLPPYPPNGAAAGRVEGSCAHDGDQRRHQQFQPLSGSEASFTYADNSAIIASPIDDSMC